MMIGFQLFRSKDLEASRRPTVPADFRLWIDWTEWPLVSFSRPPGLFDRMTSASKGSSHCREEDCKKRLKIFTGWNEFFSWLAPFESTSLRSPPSPPYLPISKHSLHWTKTIIESFDYLRTHNLLVWKIKIFVFNNAIMYGYLTAI